VLYGPTGRAQTYLSAVTTGGDTPTTRLRSPDFGAVPAGRTTPTPPTYTYRYADAVNWRTYDPSTAARVGTVRLHHLPHTLADVDTPPPNMTSVLLRAVGRTARACSTTVSPTGV